MRKVKFYIVLPEGMPNENDAKKALEIAGNIRKRIREIIK
ncbi:HEPN domain-containing protein [Thermoanaerobacterium thermosaccharolyticum]|uniref:HEPN domain-containing protein n=1 Tax=Thermoanaerobacterium thermosaccharolyticum TaxID=1517 RepID=A0A223HXR3_THETR|nr:HEPN domain-containing protein [Thermoanaerobacterium thermosaccharolyticum]